MQNSHGELRTEQNCKRIIPGFSVQQEVSLVEGNERAYACLLCDR